MSAVAASAWLIDERWEKAYPLREVVTIGRGPQNTIILRDGAVSRLHAEVKKESGGYVLHPYGSSGTKVNGLEIATPCPLREGDRVEIAYSALLFTCNAPREDMFVLPQDTPTYVDAQDTPTRITIRTASQAVSLWRRLAAWLTRRGKTD